MCFFALLASVAIHAGAWTFFGSREDALADKLRSGDKLMQKAEAAYEDGNMERAGKYYVRAIQKYEKLQEIDPTYMEGIAGIRLNYCAKQYTNALEAVAAAAEHTCLIKVVGCLLYLVEREYLHAIASIMVQRYQLF